MIVKEFEQSAVTPVLGGFFDDMKLVVKVNLPSERNKRMKELMKFEFDKSDHQKKGYIDTEQLINQSDDLALSLVVGWDNFFQKDESPVPFNDETKKKFLAEYLFMETGIQMPEFTDKDGKVIKDRLYTLKSYILDFASDMDNFLRD